MPCKRVSRWPATRTTSDIGPEPGAEGPGVLTSASCGRGGERSREAGAEASGGALDRGLFFSDNSGYGSSGVEKMA